MSVQQSYKLLNIVLIESQFKRIPEISFNSPEFENHININLEDQRLDNKIFITVTLNFTAGKSNEEEIKALIKYLGIFEFENSSELPLDEFAKVNGPAIIFPFMREHLATISMKAGIAPILLPPINFVKFTNEIKK